MNFLVSSLTLDGAATVSVTGLTGFANGAFANAGDLATELASTTEIATAVVDGTNINITYTLDAGGANDGVAFTIADDVEDGGVGAGDITAGTDGSGSGSIGTAAVTTIAHDGLSYGGGNTTIEVGGTGGLTIAATEYANAAALAAAIQGLAEVTTAEVSGDNIVIT
ncbi:hypothetical protein [Desulfobotulus mexicanus]|uniref:Uncharacterized protein n=1 Tax=Desulfobotulus mexicanus TaxID=2586642 RepID=A0A5S5MBU7_9BACT|nr:hypothetical protein [Desulfobotulus mexicanus]TYT73095.1 hypothetical protein FIM25_16935 [Desulfobotulus mexicanus]